MGTHVKSNVNLNLNAPKTQSPVCSTSNVKPGDSESQNKGFLSKKDKNISPITKLNLVPKSPVVIAKTEREDEPALKKQKIHHEEESESQKLIKVEKTKKLNRSHFSPDHKKDEKS